MPADIESFLTVSLAAIVTGSAIQIILVWLAKNWITLRLKSDIDAENAKKIEKLRAELSAENAARVESLKANLSEASSKRLEHYRTDLKASSDAQLERLRSELTTARDRELAQLRRDVDLKLHAERSKYDVRTQSTQRIWIAMNDLVNTVGQINELMNRTPIGDEGRRAFESMAIQFADVLVASSKIVRDDRPFVPVDIAELSTSLMGRCRQEIDAFHVAARCIVNDDPEFNQHLASKEFRDNWVTILGEHERLVNVIRGMG